MKITGTAIKLGAFSLVLLLFTGLIVVVFGQMRFDRTTGYSAIFSNASGLRPGQFVRASGVEVGKVSKIELIENAIAQGQAGIRLGDHADADGAAGDALEAVREVARIEQQPRAAEVHVQT